jgi:Mn-dependent DtxR family transcriptional regulator
MTPSILSPKDVTVLTTLSDYGDSVPEIVLASRLAPSEVQVALDRLRAKNLVRHAQDQVVQLTTEGRVVQRKLKSGDSHILVTDDEELLDAGQIERDLNASITKFS